MVRSRSGSGIGVQRRPAARTPTNNASHTLQRQCHDEGSPREVPHSRGRRCSYFGMFVLGCLFSSVLIVGSTNPEFRAAIASGWAGPSALYATAAARSPGATESRKPPKAPTARIRRGAALLKKLNFETVPPRDSDFFDDLELWGNEELQQPGFDFLFSTAPEHYRLSCALDPLLAPRTGERVYIHILTDNATMIYWKTGFLPEIHQMKLLRSCRSEPGPVPKGAPELVIARYSLDMWELARQATRAAGVNTGIGDLSRSKSKALFSKIVISGMLSVLDGPIRRGAPVVVLNEHNPDVHYDSVSELLHWLQVPPAQRIFLSYVSSYAEDDAGKLSASGSRGSSEKAWSRVVTPNLVKYGPGTPFAMNTYFWNVDLFLIARDMTELKESRIFCRNTRPGSAELGALLPPVQNRNKSLLILGGDPRPSRVEILFELWNQGLLENALWSLATPRECCEWIPTLGCSAQGMRYEWIEAKRWVSHPRAKEFCREFPKSIDDPIDPEDHQRSSNFLSQKFYDQTRLSFTFQSDSPDVAWNHTFVTEKPFKPLFSGHPFVLCCSTSRSATILNAFGFETYEVAGGRPWNADVSLGSWNEHRKTEVTQGKISFIKDHAVRVGRAVRAILATPPEVFRKLDRIAHKNMIHARCGGFLARTRGYTSRLLWDILQNGYPDIAWPKKPPRSLTLR